MYHLVRSLVEIQPLSTNEYVINHVKDRLSALKILAFSQFFPPEIGAAPKRISEHAIYWVKSGHQVTVVSNVPHSPFGKFYSGYRNGLCQKEIIQGVEVMRVWTLASGKKNTRVHRGLSFMVYLFMSTLVGLMNKRPDIVLASAPYLAGIPGILSSVFHRVPFIYEMRDPWVQVAATTGTIKRGGIIFRFLLAMERAIARYAKRVIVIGKEMAYYIKNEMALSDEPKVVYNGVDKDKLALKDKRIKPIHIPGAKGNFLVGSIGNMGKQYDFDIILETAKELLEENCFFLFVGEGNQKKRIKQKAKIMGLDNVAFYPAVPADEVNAWIRSCNVTVVSMRPESVFKVYVPLKVLDSLVLGVPVLFGGSGEVEHILKSCQGGGVFSSGDNRALLRLIRERMNNPEKLRTEGHSGAEFVSRTFSREKMAYRYQLLVEKVVSEKSSKS